MKKPITSITVTPDTFSLNPGEEITLTLKISPPKDIVSGEYTEYLLITCENIRGQKSVEITVEVSAKYKLTVRTSGLKDNMTKVWINDKFYGFVNDTQPLEVSLNSGEYIVKVEQYVYDDARMTRYNCTKPENTINLNSDKEITFRYESEYKLIVKAQPENGGKVEVNPNKVWFRENEEVTLKATPNEGFEFKEWRIYPYGLKCNDSKCFFTRKENPTKINMDRPKTVVAIFNPIEDWNPWNDSDSDGGEKITTAELQEAIHCWLNDEPAPKTGAEITTERLQEVIHLWLQG